MIWQELFYVVFYNLHSLMSFMELERFRSFLDGGLHVPFLTNLQYFKRSIINSPPNNTIDFFSSFFWFSPVYKLWITHKLWPLTLYCILFPGCHYQGSLRLKESEQALVPKRRKKPYKSCESFTIVLCNYTIGSSDAAPLSFESRTVLVVVIWSWLRGWYTWSFHREWALV